MDVDLKNLPKLTRKLLPRFIDEKLAHYVEPTKKGTTRGERVGFSFTKYRATLFALRHKLLAVDDDLAMQAKELKVSYGVLRKWRSEPQFKEKVAQHEKEFVAYLLEAKGQRALRQATSQLSRQIRAMKESGYGVSDADAETRVLLSMLAADLAQATAQITALENAIAVLKDRYAAMKHRKEVVALLESVKDAMQ